MRRIQFACLNQTIHFQLNSDVSHHLAVRKVEEEYEDYKKLLERNNTRHKISDEKRQEDGSIIVKVKKQLNNYDTGDYLD
jgi:hypothetical protein